MKLQNNIVAISSRALAQSIQLSNPEITHTYTLENTDQRFETYTLKLAGTFTIIIHLNEKKLLSISQMNEGFAMRILDSQQLTYPMETELK